MLRGLQMPRSRKIGLAALFLIAITDVVFDITRTVYTVDGGAVALDTIWDILEPTIAVIISALPTYKALLGPAKRKKNTSYQNLAYNKPLPWNSSASHAPSGIDDVELSLEALPRSTHFPIPNTRGGPGKRADTASVV